MSVSMARLRIAGAAALAMAAGGCARIPQHTGYIADPVLVASVQPGVDNRDSVQATLGRPSFVGEFDPTIWYYVTRETKQFAFASPKPVQQTVLAVRFDARGNVASVERSGLEKIASIRPSGDKTPTLGRHRSFFQELFGNIGQVGAAGGAGATTDNPTGRSGP